jgi:hypothetical protein
MATVLVNAHAKKSPNAEHLAIALMVYSVQATTFAMTESA